MVCWKGCRPGIIMEEVVVGVKVIPGVFWPEVSLLCSSSAASSACLGNGGVSMVAGNSMVRYTLTCIQRHSSTQ